MRSRRNWLFVAAAVAGVTLAGIAILSLRRPSPEPAVRRAQPAADSLLYIPLQHTVLARQEFLKAFRASEPQHRAALYEKFLPRIGANGIRQEIQTVHPICHDEAHDLGRLIFAKLGVVGELRRRLLVGVHARRADAVLQGQRLNRRIGTPALGTSTFSAAHSCRRRRADSDLLRESGADADVRSWRLRSWGRTRGDVPVRLRHRRGDRSM